MVLSLEASGLAFAHPGRPPLFEDVSLALAEGDVLCLLGPNGAGKTTLLRCLLGLNRPSAGRIAVRGRDMRVLPPRRLAREVAYVPQDTPNVFAYSALDIVLMGRSPYLRFLSTPGRADIAMARQALEELEVGRLGSQPFAQLSGGERQLVLIARALAQESRLLLLDEPASSLDYGNQIRILRTVRRLARRGFTIVMTSHAPDHAMLACNRVAMLKDGRLRAGTPAEIIGDGPLSALYDTPIHVIEATVPTGAGRRVTACVPIMED